VQESPLQRFFKSFFLRKREREFAGCGARGSVKLRESIQVYSGIFKISTGWGNVKYTLHWVLCLGNQTLDRDLLFLSSSIVLRIIKKKQISHVIILLLKIKSCVCILFWKCFLKKIKKNILKDIFLIFSYYFNVLISKIIFKK